MKPAESKSNRLRQIEALLIEHPEGLTQAEIVLGVAVFAPRCATYCGMSS